MHNMHVQLYGQKAKSLKRGQPEKLPDKHFGDLRDFNWHGVLVSFDMSVRCRIQAVRCQPRTVRFQQRGEMSVWSSETSEMSA